MTDSINLQFTTIKTPLPDFIYAGLAEYSKAANLYHPQPPELIFKLSQKHQLPSDMIYLTAGIDEAIQMFAKAYGQNAFVFTPTYTVYGDVEEFGGKLTRLPSIVDLEFHIDPSTIPGASLVYLANPNNPSGVTSRETVISLIENNPQAIVVIDEAYGEFADLSVIDLVPKYANVAVFRSFSKAYGMAGNRVGFIATQKAIIDVVKNKSQWSNISYLSVGAAMIALDHEDYFIQLRQDISTRREEFIAVLSQGGLKVFPSAINAVLLKFESESIAQQFVDHLSEHSIVVSHGNGSSNMGLDKSYVRIAIGTKEQMQTVKQVIVNFTSEQNT